MAAACFSLPESPWVQLDQRQRIRRFLSFLLMITLIIFWPEEELKLVHYEALASLGTLGQKVRRLFFHLTTSLFSGLKKASVSLVSPVISFFHVPLGILRATRLLDEPSEVFLEMKYALSCSARSSHGGAEMDSTTVRSRTGGGLRGPTAKEEEDTGREKNNWGMCFTSVVEVTQEEKRRKRREKRVGIIGT